MLLNPDRFLLWAPSSIKLQAGILDRLVRPPAIPTRREGGGWVKNKGKKKKDGERECNILPKSYISLKVQ